MGALADEIGDAPKKLGEASYSFAKEVDWNNGLYLQAPGAVKPLEALKSTVNGADAEKAYAGFLEFKDVAKKNQVASAGPTASVPSGDKIGEAAKKLSDASYPFLKE